jgi:hypothetical protein
MDDDEFAEGVEVENAILEMEVWARKLLAELKFAAADDMVLYPTA